MPCSPFYATGSVVTYNVTVPMLLYAQAALHSEGSLGEKLSFFCFRINLPFSGLSKSNVDPPCHKGESLVCPQQWGCVCVYVCVFHSTAWDSWHVQS